jgi:DNA-binding NarL/FixJ family response regulator
LLLDRVDPVSTGAINASRLLECDPEAVAVARAQGDEADYALTIEPLQCRTREETEQVLALARTWQRPAAVMRALDAGARDLLHRHGAVHDAVETLIELLAASVRYGSIPAEAEAYVQLCAAHAALGELALARDEEARARELVERLGPQHRLHVILDLVIASLLAYLTDGDFEALARRAARFSASRDASRGPLGPAWAALAVVNLSCAGAEGARSRERERITEMLNAALTAFRSLGMDGWERRALRLHPFPDRLTAREAEVLGLLAAGRTNKEIASQLVLTPATVERHVTNLYRKIGVRRRAEAATYALDHGLLQR